MSKKATLTDIGSGYASGTTLDANFDAINDKLDNTVSRDGSTPNSMEADFDLNNYDLINGKYLYGTRLYLNGTRVTSTDANITWQGGWATTTAYEVDHLAREDGIV